MTEPDSKERAKMAFARLIHKLFRGGQAFVGVEATLSGLDAAQATTRTQNLPHSVAESAAHINWWNRCMLDIIEIGHAQPYPKHATDTWPEVQ